MDRGTDSTNPLVQVCILLVEGMARSALPFDRDEYAEFRGTLQDLSSSLMTTSDPETLLGVAEAATDALERYNRGAQRVQAAQTVELRCMI